MITYPVAYGRPVPAAMLEQMTLSKCVYNNDATLTLALLDVLGRVAVVRGTWNRELETPDYLIWRDGPNFGVVFDGSNTWAQIRNIVGGCGECREGADEFGRLHSWLNKTYRAIKNDIFKNLPEVLRGKLILSGHSLGGMIAFRASYDAVQRYGPQNVALMTYGAPKIWFGKVPGAYPHDAVFIVNKNDPAPYYPWSIPSQSFNAITFVLSKIYDMARDDWSQPRQMYRLTIGKKIEANTASDFRSFALPKTAAKLIYATDHELTEYIRSAGAIALGDNPTPQTMAVWLKALEAIAVGDSKAGVADPNPRDYVDVDQINRVDFPGIAPQISAANLDTLSAVSLSSISVQRDEKRNIFDEGGLQMAALSGLYKVTFIINALDLGRSESHVLKIDGGFTPARNAALQLAYLRAFLLGNGTTGIPNNKQSYDTPQLQFIRVSDALNPRNSLLINLTTSQNYFGYGTGAGPGPSDAMSTSLSMRMPGKNVDDANASGFGNLEITGIPDSVVVSRQYFPSAPAGPGTTYNERFMNYLNALINTSFAWGFVGQSSLQEPKNVEAVSLTTANLWQLKVSAHGYTTKDKIRLTSTKTAGWNGTYTITVVDLNNFTLNSGPPSDSPAPAQGTVRRIQSQSGARLMQFYRYQVPNAGMDPTTLVSIRKKNPGRAFALQSFKRRTRKAR